MSLTDCPSCGYSLVAKQIYLLKEDDLEELNNLNKKGEAIVLTSDNGNGPYIEPNTFLDIEGFELFTSWYNSKVRLTTPNI